MEKHGGLQSVGSQSQTGLSNQQSVFCLVYFPGQNTGVGSRSLLQGIFLTQGSNAGLPHWSQILYQLGHQGGPKGHVALGIQWFPHPSVKITA